jgi:hypothetical protein
MRIREAKKHTDPDPQHYFKHKTHNTHKIAGGSTSDYEKGWNTDEKQKTISQIQGKWSCKIVNVAQPETWNQAD